MKRINVLFLLLSFFYSTTQAQEVSVGLRAGATYFTIHNDDFNGANKFTMGLDLAIPVEVSFNSVFSIQPELHYTQKGASFDVMEDGQEQELTFRTDFLELPVLFKANYGTDAIRCFAFVGPSFGYAIKRQVIQDMDGSDAVKEEIEFINNGEAQDRRWELGAVGGIGVAFKAGPGAFVVDARYALDFIDDVKFSGERPADLERSTNRGCTLSVGYKIPLN